MASKIVIVDPTETLKQEGKPPNICPEAADT